MINDPIPAPLLPEPDRDLRADWLDLQATLKDLLHQGDFATDPLPRLEGIEKRALALLDQDLDECLFVLFQALGELSLGYCATHALLSAVVCSQTANRLGMPDAARQTLFRSALVMNIGMARTQDDLARQNPIPSAAQRKLIREHPQISCEMLRRFGVTDADWLDIVRWHHELEESAGLARNRTSRRLLRAADCLIARMAPRTTRLAMAPLNPAAVVVPDTPEDATAIGNAMMAVVGFYPPGTYVQLVNGEKAVSVARGARANQPHVVSLVNPGGMPLRPYLYRDTSDPQFAIRSPLNAEKIKVKVSLEAVLNVVKSLSDPSD
ncbi:HD-GYP domain-containing protein [Rhodoferax ferrireducens]|uniref:HD-GYP domain-containing protein n=1 Tax=Rhodoferax ferrireducens TaxID=192843 RepID=UPI000E0D59B3|nr:HD domain-containing protein [Rhodoferax ferrireducens]